MFFLTERIISKLSLDALYYRASKFAIWKDIENERLAITNGTKKDSKPYISIMASWKPTKNEIFL